MYADQANYQKIAKSHRDLRAIVEKFREYKGVLQGIEESKAMSASETDPEMRKLADEELLLLEDRAMECQKELQLLLMPKDPNDEKNVLLEYGPGPAATRRRCSRPSFSGCIAGSRNASDGAWK